MYWHGGISACLYIMLCVCCIFLCFSVKVCYKYKYISLFCSSLLCDTNICIIFVSTKTNKTNKTT